MKQGLTSSHWWAQLFQWPTFFFLHFHTQAERVKTKSIQPITGCIPHRFVANRRHAVRNWNNIRQILSRFKTLNITQSANKQKILRNPFGIALEGHSVQKYEKKKIKHTELPTMLNMNKFI